MSPRTLLALMALRALREHQPLLAKALIALAKSLT